MPSDQLLSKETQQSLFFGGMLGSFAMLLALLLFGDRKHSREEKFRQRLVNFYLLHNPSKLTQVNSILKRYKGNEELLFKRLQRKYQVEDRESTRGGTMDEQEDEQEEKDERSEEQAEVVEPLVIEHEEEQEEAKEHEDGRFERRVERERKSQELNYDSMQETKEEKEELPFIDRPHHPQETRTMIESFEAEGAFGMRQRKKNVGQQENSFDLISAIINSADSPSETKVTNPLDGSSTAAQSTPNQDPKPEAKDLLTTLTVPTAKSAGSAKRSAVRDAIEEARRAQQLRVEKRVAQLSARKGK